MPVTFRIGEQDPMWEPQVWRLYELLGGTIDPNADSAQVASVMPWKADPPAGAKAVRLIQAEDFDAIATLIGLNPTNTAKMKLVGLYSAGKELAALRERAYR